MKQVIIAFLLTLIFPAVVFASDGYIQIDSQPGVEIFLNGKSKGITTKEQNGLILQDIPSGTYSIEASYNEYKPQKQRVVVNNGKVSKITISKFELAKGKLTIQSLPVDVTIHIDGKKHSKATDELVLDLPVGQHEIIAEGIGKQLKYTVDVSDLYKAHLFINFVKGEVDDIGLKNKKGQVLLNQVLTEADFTLEEYPEGKVLIDNKSGVKYEWYRPVSKDYILKLDAHVSQLRKEGLGPYKGNWRVPNAKVLRPLQRLIDEINKYADSEKAEFSKLLINSNNGQYFSFFMFCSGINFYNKLSGSNYRNNNKLKDYYMGHFWIYGGKSYLNASCNGSGTPPIDGVFLLVL